MPEFVYEDDEKLLQQTPVSMVKRMNKFPGNLEFLSRCTKSVVLPNGSVEQELKSCIN